MGNDWFQFKKFKVYQAKNAMKVTTDACLFGALMPDFDPSEGLKMLDIGTGTGLLTLMLAQKNPEAQITAVEINPDFAAEAQNNFTQSSFSKQIRLVVADIFDYYPTETFHFIACNPPFYKNQLQSPVISKNLAHHSPEFSIEHLMKWIKTSLHSGGTASILLPFYREKEVTGFLQNNDLETSMIIRIRQTSKHPFFRSIIQVIHKQGNKHPFEKSITIKEAENQYTLEFNHLLSPFYLHL